MCELMYNYAHSKVWRYKPTWISGDIKSRIAYKNDLYRKAKLSNKGEEWEIFKIVKKEVSEELKTAKIDYMKGRLNENRGDPKTFWRVLNKEMLGKKRGEGVKAIKNEVGRLLYGVEAANYMNSYYAEMGKAGAGSRWYIYIYIYIHLYTCTYVRMYNIYV